MKEYKKIQVIDNMVGTRIDNYLKENYLYSTRLLRKMKFTLNGQKIGYNRKFNEIGEFVIYYEDKNTNIKPIKMNLDICYEDEDILVVNKPPFLLTHPTLKKADKTLANGIVYYFDSKILPRFYNRLDMNTSGLIIIAKNSKTQALLQSDETKIIKKYMAIAENVADFDTKIVEENIYYPEDGSLKRVVDKKGKYAKTQFKLIKNYENKNLCLLECQLFTGRTHQIRVHLKHINHPLIGDELYNENSKKNAPRQMLHSFYLKIENKEKNIEIEIDMYDDMKMYLI